MGRALIQSHRTSFDLNWPFKHNSTASEDLAYPCSDCAGWDPSLIGNTESAQGWEPTAGVTLTAAGPICPGVGTMPVSLASGCQLALSGSTAALLINPIVCLLWVSLLLPCSHVSWISEWFLPVKEYYLTIVCTP